jgi:hypothetical protein
VLHSSLVFLHVLAVSVWFGAALWVAGDVKRALAAGRAEAETLRARLGPALGLDVVGGVAVLVTGGLLMWEQRMGMPPHGILVGIVATLLRLGVLAAMRRAFRGVLARVQAGEAVAASDPAAKRMAMFSGIAHVLWMIALAGMVS